VPRPTRPQQALSAGPSARSGAVAFPTFRSSPVDLLAGLIAAAGVATILVNALFFQEGRHPAPFYGQSGSNGAAAEAPRRNELVAQIQGELLSRGYYEGPVDGLIGSRTAAAIHAFELSARIPETGEASERVLAALLIAPARKPEAAAARPTPAPVPAAKPTPQAKATPAAAPSPVTTTGSTAAPSPKLMAVQRALSRLGYGPVTLDGKMGAETRTALSEFERDRKLPVTGEPGSRTLKELQAMTGAPLE
jgi:peptidoglycan hydrolase-like protein with peptidoglycan-binding domain